LITARSYSSNGVTDSSTIWDRSEAKRVETMYLRSERYYSKFSRVGFLWPANQMSSLLTGVNFNLLRAAFWLKNVLQRFYVLTVWVCNFLVKENRAATFFRWLYFRWPHFRWPYFRMSYFWQVHKIHIFPTPIKHSPLPTCI